MGRIIIILFLITIVFNFLPYCFASVSCFFFFFKDGAYQYRSISAQYYYAVRADLSKGFWNTKRKLGVTTHFSDIIKKQYFKKAVRHKAMYGVYFSKLKLYYL